MFNSVSILFSDVVTFTEICSRITPMEVVSMLNAMYSIFDNLTERNNVYKVETIGKKCWRFSLLVSRTEIPINTLNFYYSKNLKMG